MKALLIDCKFEPKDQNCKDQCNERVENGNLYYKTPKLEYVNYSIPELKSNEVLINVKKVGLCGTDIHCFETGNDDYILFSGPAKFPQIIGHEFAGVVAETGSDVKHVKKGDYVACESVLWCGYCDSCRKGFFSECENVELVGLTVPGALADYVVIPHTQVWSINPLVNKFGIEKGLALGTLLEPFGCAYKGIYLHTNNKCLIGTFAAVYGAGPIGLGAAWMLKLSGVKRVFVFEKNPHRIKLSRSLGFEDTVDINEIESISDFLLTETNGKGVFMNVECSGAGDVVIPEIVKSISPKGTIIYLSRTGKRNVYIDFDMLMSKGNTIIGSRGHAGTFTLLLDAFLTPGASYISDVITKEICFKDLKSFIENKEYLSEGKVIVNF